MLKNQRVSGFHNLNFHKSTMNVAPIAIAFLTGWTSAHLEKNEVTLREMILGSQWLHKTNQTDIPSGYLT